MNPRSLRRPKGTTTHVRLPLTVSLATLAAVSALLLVCHGCPGAPGLPVPVTSPCLPPPVNKVVIVVEENKGYSQIIGNPDAPYINRLAAEGANFTQSYAVTHPSQPNYIALFSGSTQFVYDNAVFNRDFFTTPNLGAKLLAAGLTFAGYSEDLPAVGSDVEHAGAYRRKHNPWVNWQWAGPGSPGLPPNKLPPSVNLPFTSFPADFGDLPTVSFVVPNQNNDMHDGSIGQADAWLQQQLGTYVEWARTHEALLILTFDEDNGLEFNRIVTIFHGPMVQPGDVGVWINHYSVLRTLEDMFNLPHDAATPGTLPVPCETWRERPAADAGVNGRRPL